MAAVWYATREQVKSALASKETARNNDQIDRLIGASTDSIENDLLHRRFYPEVDTRTFDWPSHADPDGTRMLSLGRDEVVDLSALTVGGVAVDPANYTLLPTNDGPPYTSIELDATVTLAGSARRAIGGTGPFGFGDTQDVAGTLGAAVGDASTPTITVTDSGIIGVGHLLKVDAERLIVAGKSMVDTGQNLGADITEKTNVEAVPVGSGAAFHVGEMVMIDAERMLIVEIAGNTLVVKRGWDGSTSAAHTTGADVYAPRQLTVRRGVLGTSGATHGDGAAITKLAIPRLVNQLCIAESLTAYMQENTGYGRTIGSADSERAAAGAGLEDLRRRAWEAYGRKAYRPSTWSDDDGL